MPDDRHDLERLSPDQLVAGFSKSKIAAGLVIAVLAHLLVLGATSVGYIRDRWIDPEGAAQRKQERVAARKAEQERAEAAINAQAQPRTPDDAKAQPPKDAAAIPDDRKGAPVVKDITDLPKPGEVPRQPDNLGISIDDTNP